MKTVGSKRTSPWWRRGLWAATCLALSSCTALTTDVLVNDAGRPKSPVTTHCAGSEWMDNSMVAVVPIPIIAFASPTQEINEINSSNVLRRCGPPEQLVNRHVEVDRAWCAPLVLTRLISLGVWHWCPANVSYEADVSAPPAPPAATSQAPSEPSRDVAVTVGRMR